jgi:AraC-like DNA-binding protein
MRIERRELVGEADWREAVEIGCHGASLRGVVRLGENSTDGLQRLERSCGPALGRRDWFRVAPDDSGPLRVEADLSTFRYAPHRHDSYAIGVTLAGVQSFSYRRARRDCLPGQVIVLHPDEIHDGQAGTEAGFRYWMIYIDPAEMREALGGTARTLPFLKDGHGTEPLLRQAVVEAVTDLDRPLSPLEQASSIQAIADALLRLDPGAAATSRREVSGVARSMSLVRDLLITETTMSMAALEGAVGLSRFELSRQFRRAYGTSPYRYQMMRRLERARFWLGRGGGIAETAHRCGFADQSHLTRQFRDAYGITPGQWRAMTCTEFQGRH